MYHPAPCGPGFFISGAGLAGHRTRLIVAVEDASVRNVQGEPYEPVETSALEGGLCPDTEALRPPDHPDSVVRPDHHAARAVVRPIDLRKRPRAAWRGRSTANVGCARWCGGALMIRRVLPGSPRAWAGSSFGSLPRDGELHHATAGRSVRCTDRSAVFVSDLPDDRKPQPGTRCPSRGR